MSRNTLICREDAVRLCLSSIAGGTIKSAFNREDRRRDASEPSQRHLRRSRQGLWALLRPTPNHGWVTRRLQDTLAWRPAGQHPGRPREGQGLSGPPSLAAIDKLEEK